MSAAVSGADRSLLTALAAHLDTGPNTAAHTPGARARVIAGVAVAIAQHRGTPLPPLALLDQWGSPMPITIPGDAARPELLGALYETLLDQGTRRRRGAFYTPGAVASVVVSWALGAVGERAGGTPVICDPAVGGGVFLLAAANALAARGLAREAVVGRCLIGADLDPVAVAVSEATLALWCDGRAVPRLVVADALTLDVDDWPEHPDVVVGNPPFLSQLSLATVRTREEAEALARRFGEGLGGYADTAALFWVMACRLVSAGGSVALVLPQSTLAVRDAQGVRRVVLAEMTPEVLWLPGQALFGASVDVCVIVVCKRTDRSVVLRTYTGVPPRHRHDTNVVIDELRQGANWSHLVADAMGVPSAGLAGNGEMIGDRWRVVADFRGFRLHLIATTTGLPITFALTSPKDDERMVARYMLTRASTSRR
ncbi:MAG: N-6 DNA methylase [Actinobacteria bacterium]|nr:N-6 DNA methylase [Actinomycetota bacterium]